MAVEGEQEEKSGWLRSRSIFFFVREHRDTECRGGRRRAQTVLRPRSIFLFFPVGGVGEIFLVKREFLPRIFNTLFSSSPSPSIIELQNTFLLSTSFRLLFSSISDQTSGKVRLLMRDCKQNHTFRACRLVSRARECEFVNEKRGRRCELANLSVHQSPAPAGT